MSSTKLQTVVVDSDGLIALFHKDDAHFLKAQALFVTLYEQNAALLYPSTTIVETIDTLQRKFKNHETAGDIARLITSAEFADEAIVSVDSAILKQATTLFASIKNTHHTLADAIVATIAKKYQTDLIFSFDNGYRKLGFKLITDL